MLSAELQNNRTVQSRVQVVRYVLFYYKRKLQHNRVELVYVRKYVIINPC